MILAINVAYLKMGVNTADTILFGQAVNSGSHTPHWLVKTD